MVQESTVESAAFTLSNDKRRISGLDSLRGLAALSVAFTHFTSTYYTVYRLPHPRVTVNMDARSLFLIMSGFVILMTLDRCKTVADFAALRFARLYPIFWTCLSITYVVVHVANLPGRQTSLHDAFINATMMPALFGAPPVDVVYWTLRVELCFYLILGSIVGLGLRRFLIPIVSGLSAWGAVNHYFPLAQLMPRGGYRLETMLILQYWPLLLLGIVIFDLRSGFRKKHAFGLGIGVTVVLLQRGIGGLGQCAFAGILWLITTYSVPVLTTKPLLYVGKVSYSFYLIHANVGYCIIQTVLNYGGNPYGAAVLAFAGTFSLGSILYFFVEAPSNRIVRAAWKNQHIGHLSATLLAGLRSLPKTIARSKG